MTRRNTFFGIWLFFSMLIGITGVVPSAQAQPETLTIAAANSLKDALRKVLPRFEAEHPAINVRVIYGPSQSLRKQIEEGAPVDIFLPSLFDEIDQLETKGLIIQGTKRAFAGTSLVLITGAALPAPVRTIHDLETVPVRRIAIGDPKTSSVGKVAAQFLKYSKLEPKNMGAPTAGYDQLALTSASNASLPTPAPIFTPIGLRMPRQYSTCAPSSAAVRMPIQGKWVERLNQPHWRGTCRVRACS